MNPFARRFQHRLQKGDNGAFAIGARDMDNARQFVLRAPQRFEQPLHALQRQIDDFRVEAFQPRKNIRAGFILSHGEAVRLSGGMCEGCHLKAR